MSGRNHEVELDDHGAALPQLLDEVLVEGAVELHLVDVDTEQPLEILRLRLEERPLVTLEVRAHGSAEHSERLVTAGVDELDQDVGVAVRLGVIAIGVVQPVRTVGVGVESEQAEHVASYDAVPQSCAADLRRPGVGLDAVLLEERERDALEAEPDARSVRGASIRAGEAVERGEVLAVAVERRDRRRLRRRRSGRGSRT